MSRSVDFTCLLPVWAGDDAALFRQAALSVEASTLPPAETLICQDGPLTEPLAAAVEALCAGGRFRVVVNPGPRGLHHNLNHAASAVRTGWIARMDSDDLNLPDRFAAQVAFLDAHPKVDILGGAIEEVSPAGRVTRRTTPLDHRAIVRRARWRSPMNHMTVFMRLEALRAVGGYPDIPRKEDYGLWLLMIGSDRVFANLPQDLVRVRLGADFAGRRAGLRNLASEYRLFAIRRRLPGLGGAAGAVAFAARAVALSSQAPAELLYRYVLR
jgi:glycosyltransferase involved in cell wall biosynthesis